MARVCQVSGKRANNAKHIRNQHSQGWKYKAPKKNRVQLPNLHTVKVRTPHGVVKLTVSTSVLKSEEFNMVLCGLKPLPKEWTRRATYGV